MEQPDLRTSTFEAASMKRKTSNVVLVMMMMMTMAMTTRKRKGRRGILTRKSSSKFLSL